MQEKNNPYLDNLRNLVLEYVRGYPVNVFLFGSRALGKEHKLSDVDIAILPIKPLPIAFISNLKEIIDESTIPYLVDIVDLSQVDESFRKKILSEAIEWKD